MKDMSYSEESRFPVTGGKRRKNSRKNKKRKITRKITRGGQALPRPTLSFLRSFVDPNAVNRIYNNTAKIRISYPTTIADDLYKLDVKLLGPTGVNITSTKIKNINSIRELTVNELQVSTRYQLTVKLVNKTTNNKSVDSNTLTIEIARPPAPRPAPAPAPRPAPRPITGIITTVAGGNGASGFSGDGGPGTSARVHFPYGVAVDGGGNVLIADTGNTRIRRVAAGTGIITTLAGNGAGGFSGDGGPATSASLGNPYGVAVDRGGNVLIADSSNSRIRRVAAGTGIITTIAGTGADGFSGDGGAATSARLSFPWGLAVDAGGNVLITDNHRIRRVAAATRVITTVAGNGENDFSGDGGLATSASLRNPSGVAVDGGGNVLIADTNNHRIRKVTGPFL